MLKPNIGSFNGLTMGAECSGFFVSARRLCLILVAQTIYETIFICCVLCVFVCVDDNVCVNASSVIVV